jgi:peptide/nickel transport system permease protein
VARVQEVRVQAPVASRVSPHRRSGLWHAYRRDPGALTGTAVLVAAVLVAFLAPYIAATNPQAQDLSRRLQPPTWVPGLQFLGTDSLGREIFDHIVYGLRVSLLVGLLSIVISAGLGVSSGIASGFFRGRLDALVMRAVDMQLSLPTLLVALAAAAIWGRGVFKLIVVIGVVGWAEYARTVRGSTLAVREQEFVEAARALGASDLWIMRRHLLPNVLTPVIVLISVSMPRVIVLEATLSFLGLGVPLTTPSLGLMIDSGYRYLFSGAWWPSIMPGVALMILVMGINLVGDWLRDALDPHLYRT